MPGTHRGHCPKQYLERSCFISTTSTGTSSYLYKQEASCQVAARAVDLRHCCADDLCASFCGAIAHPSIRKRALERTVTSSLMGLGIAACISTIELLTGQEPSRAVESYPGRIPEHATGNTIVISAAQRRMARDYYHLRERKLVDDRHFRAHTCSAVAM
jgi:hypothetical protein